MANMVALALEELVCFLVLFYCIMASADIPKILKDQCPAKKYCVIVFAIIALLIEMFLTKFTFRHFIEDFTLKVVFSAVVVFFAYMWVASRKPHVKFGDQDVLLSLAFPISGFGALLVASMSYILTA